MIIKDNDNISRIAVRAGLSQGSRSSAYVASKMLEPSLDVLNGSLGLIYIDNLTVGGATEEAVVAKLDALASQMAKHPAGPHQLKFRRIRRVGGDINILGYRVRRNSPDYGGHAVALPSRASIHKFQQQLCAQLIMIGGKHHDDAIEAWSRKWPTYFPEWPARNTSSDLAYITGVVDVLPLAEIARRAVVRAETSFRSFSELRQLSRALATLIWPTPDWAVIGAQVLTGIKEGKKSTVPFNPGRLLDERSCMEVIRKFEQQREK